MRVLVTNDDGVEAPGLHALAGALHAAGHEVLVVAPSGERSGSGAAIGRLHRGGPLACTEVHWAELPQIPVHAVDTTPAATVYAGLLGAFGPPPDAVASGVNPGANYGHLVLHSGTVGAALTAAAIGVPAIAMSLAWGAELHWHTAARFAAHALEWVAAASDHGPLVANVNVPNLTLTDVRGVRSTHPAPFNEEWKADARAGEIELEYVGRRHEPVAGTDQAAVLDGYVSVTVLRGMSTVDGSGAAAALSAGQSGQAARS